MPWRYKPVFLKKTTQYDMELEIYHVVDSVDCWVYRKRAES